MLLSAFFNAILGYVRRLSHSDNLSLVSFFCNIRAHIIPCIHTLNSELWASAARALVHGTYKHSRTQNLGVAQVVIPHRLQNSKMHDFPLRMPMMPLYHTPPAHTKPTPGVFIGAAWLGWTLGVCGCPPGPAPTVGGLRLHLRLRVVGLRLSHR